MESFRDSGREVGSTNSLEEKEEVEEPEGLVSYRQGL